MGQLSQNRLLGREKGGIEGSKAELETFAGTAVAKNKQHRILARCTLSMGISKITLQPSRKFTIIPL